MTGGGSWRSILLSVCLVAAAAGLSAVADAPGGAMPPRLPLSALAERIDGWTSAGDDALPAEVLAVLGLDDHVNRVYHRGAASRPAALYIAYYASQRHGESLHSPLNCLPGSGWQPLSAGRQAIAIPAAGATRTIEVNRYVVQKGATRMLVLYWYASQGRVIAGEYEGKLYTVIDALRTRRTDAALVRVAVPIRTGETADAAAADAMAFVGSLVPRLADHLPV